MSKKEPKYRLVQNKLRHEITSGKFENGDQFYTEAELLELFDASSITIIRALKELEKEGFIERRQGIGTFVTRSRKEKLVKFTDKERFNFSNDLVKVLSVERGNDPNYMKLLKLHKCEYYYKISRVRFDGDQPYIFHQSYLPHDFVTPNLSLESYSSIYNRYRHDFNIHMLEESFQETNEIVLPVPEQVRSLLKLTEYEPAILQIKTTTSRKLGRVLEYTETYKHWHYFKFEIRSEKD
ncbi:GntR family transcriptional regulator [Streptococcus hongkongensis]|nr:GntR family transcriptional regulator [Streptococcus uberis]